MIDEASTRYKLLSPVSAGEGSNLLEAKSSEEGMRRLQALLADWLRMENIVILTGAGCSVDLGGRLMAGPEEKNLECLVLDAVQRTDIPESAKSVIRHRVSQWPDVNNAGPQGFEEWLSYLFNVSTLTSHGGSPIDSIQWKGKDVDESDVMQEVSDDDLEILRSKIERAIFAECALEIEKGELSRAESEDGGGHFPFLAKLIARDPNLGRAHLFTLNYDTLFEQAMEELGIQYFDGFAGKCDPRFDPSVYGLDIYYPGDVAEGRVRRFDKFLQYYKLHGSLHWYVDDNDVYRARHRDLSFVRHYRNADVDCKAELLDSPALADIRSFGILPTSQKFTQTLGMPYAHLFRLFQSRLNQPQTFFLVLGYGFSDEHVTRIIETALMNPSLIMLVVEPNPNSPIVERICNYQSLGQRAFILTERVDEGEKCTYQVATFSDFARNVMPDVKWLEDYRRLRSFEDQIRKTEQNDILGGTGGA